MADTPLSSQMEAEYKVSKWNRNTVADGSWLQKYTIEKLNDRDIFLANNIDSATGDLTSALEAEKAARIDGDEYISAALTSVSSDFYNFSGKVETSAANITNTINVFSGKVEQSAYNLNSALNDEVTRASAAEENLQGQINTLEAATDVIMVYGTYSSTNSADPTFVNTSGNLWEEPGYLTENDVIKVLIDNSDGNSANQTYYQATNVNHETSSCLWTKIGSLEPYYSVADLNNAAGTNINITTANGIKINTNDNVEFSSVSSTEFSGTNISALNLYIPSADNGARFISEISSNSTGISAHIVGQQINKNIDTSWESIINAANDPNEYVPLTAEECEIGNDNSASNCSLAQGSVNSAKNNTFAQGLLNSASDCSIAQGFHNNANLTSVAQGYYSSASNYTIAQGYYNTASYYSFVQGNNNSAESGSIAQGSINSAKDYSLAQGSHNTAKSWSVALGDSAYANNKSFAINYSYAENGSFALNYNWAGDSTVISTATNNSFSMGNNNSADQNSFVVGHNNNAYENFIYGTNNKGKNSTIIGNNNEILCYSAGASEDLHTTVVGNFAERITVPGITSTTWLFAHSQSAEKIRFSVGNGNADNQRSNALTLYDDGTLELATKNNGSNYQTGLKHTKITNKGIYGYFGSDSYVAFHPHNIIEGKNCYPWDGMRAYISNRNNLYNINSRNIIIYGGNFDSWIGFYVTANPQNYVYNSLHFKIMRANPLVGYNLFFAIPSAYSITWNGFGYYSASTWCNTPKYDYFTAANPPSNSSTISITTATNVNFINSADSTNEYCQIVCPSIPGEGIVDVYLDPKSNTFIMTKCGGYTSY